MGFLEELIFKAGNEEAPQNYRAVLSANATSFFENVREIIKFTPTEIVFGLKKGCLVLKGEGLLIKRYVGGDVCVSGTLSSVSVSGGERR